MLVRLVGAEDTGPYRESVVKVWNRAFGPVQDEREWSSTIWERHRCRAGYRLAVAHDDDRLIGFAWGYTGDLGQYWADLVSSTLGSAATGWVGGHFEFVELAVSPTARRRGVGGALHDQLLHDLPHDRGLLSTTSDPTDPAVRLYLSRGWRQIGLLDEHTQVMGILHPGQRQA